MPTEIPVLRRADMARIDGRATLDGLTPFEVDRLDRALSVVSTEAMRGFVDYRAGLAWGVRNVARANRDQLVKWTLEIVDEEFRLGSTEVRIGSAAELQAEA